MNHGPLVFEATAPSTVNATKIRDQIQATKMIEEQRNIYGVVVVAQLAEWSLQIQEVCGSNHEKIFIPNMFTINCQKDENKEKRGQEWTTLKKETSPELECLTYLVINNYHN